MGKLFVILQYLIPHHLLSAVMHAVTRIEWPPLKNYIIRRVIDIYQVDLSSAQEQHPQNYPSFNAFFTRALAEDARPIATGGTACSPVDGTVSQAGDIKDGRIFQAKGQDYSLRELLGDDEQSAEFENGRLATLYLSPRDYHRIHMPCDGSLERMLHVPGRLFSVAPHTVNNIEGIFARNERVVSLFKTDAGPMALSLIGAINVGADISPKTEVAETLTWLQSVVGQFYLAILVARLVGAIPVVRQSSASRPEPVLRNPWPGSGQARPSRIRYRESSYPVRSGVCRRYGPSWPPAPPRGFARDR